MGNAVHDGLELAQGNAIATITVDVHQSGVSKQLTSIGQIFRRIFQLVAYLNIATQQVYQRLRFGNTNAAIDTITVRNRYAARLGNNRSHVFTDEFVTVEQVAQAVADGFEADFSVVALDVLNLANRRRIGHGDGISIAYCCINRTTRQCGRFTADAVAAVQGVEVRIGYQSFQRS